MKESPQRWSPKVIEGDRISRRVERKAEQITPRPEVLLQEDADYYLQHKDRVAKAMERGNDITIHFLALEDRPHESAGDGSQVASVHFFSLEALTDYVLKHAEAEWNADPDLYEELPFVLEDRLEAIKKLLGEKET